MFIYSYYFGMRIRKIKPKDEAELTLVYIQGVATPCPENKKDI